MNSEDTAFVLLSAALVMFMIPGIALFYGGMVRAKNVVATIMQRFFALGLVSVLWVAVAYSLAFGPDVHHIIGSLQYAGFAGVGETPNAALAPTILHLAFAAFQLIFAAIISALVIGAFAERMKFSAFAVFTSLWLLLIYAPLAHWVWAPGGWIHNLGALDFAGGTVVHINSGLAGFVSRFSSVVIGLVAGVGCAFAIGVKEQVGYDDALDAVGAHGVKSVIGALLIGLFIQAAVNSAGANGLFAGGGLSLLGKQALAVGAAVGFSFAGSWLLLKLIDLTMGLRVSEEEETAGLDHALRQERGYVFVEHDELDVPPKKKYKQLPGQAGLTVVKE